MDFKLLIALFIVSSVSAVPYGQSYGSHNVLQASSQVVQAYSESTQAPSYAQETQAPVQAAAPVTQSYSQETQAPLQSVAQDVQASVQAAPVTQSYGGYASSSVFVPPQAPQAPARYGY